MSDMAVGSLKIAGGSYISTMSVVWVYILALLTLVAVGSLKLFRRGPTLSTAEVKRLQRHKQVCSRADGTHVETYAS